MLNRIATFVSAVIIIAFSSCANDNTEAKPVDTAGGYTLTKEQLLDSIGKQEAIMRDTTQEYNPQKAMSVLRLYTEYANRFPDDTLTAEYLFRGSDIAQGNGNYQQAAEFLETIIDRHTDYRNYVASCFAAALIYDNFLENVNNGGDRAIELYDFIIKKYPNSYYAEQAKVLKEYVGKPDSVYYNDLRKKMKAQENQ